MKYRKALLDEAVTTIIQETAAEIAERFPIEMEAIGMEQNHIHLLGSTHPKVAPGRIMQRFKSITVRKLFRRNLMMKRVLWGGKFWTDGYVCGHGRGVGNWHTVERYVQLQGQPRVDLRQLRMFEFCDTPLLAAGNFILRRSTRHHDSSEPPLWKIDKGHLY